MFRARIFSIFMGAMFLMLTQASAIWCPGPGTLKGFIKDGMIQPMTESTTYKPLNSKEGTLYEKKGFTYKYNLYVSSLQESIF